LDQLPPETEDTLAPYPWHQSSDYAHNIELARDMARSVCFQASELDKSFTVVFKNREREFIDLCNSLSTAKGVDELVVNDENFAKTIFGPATVEEEDSGSSTEQNGESEIEDSDSN
jgi:hypothetical protein